MTVYKYKEITNDPTIHEVLFEGELRAGRDIESEDFQSLIKRIKKASETKIVIIDVSSLFFWDSEGMRKILIPVREINQKQVKRAIIIGKLESKNFERAKEKYDIGTDSIPWYPSKDEFLKTI